MDKDVLKEILTLFETEKVPANYQLEMLGSIHDSFIRRNRKRIFQ